MGKIIYKTNEQLKNLKESGKYLTELLSILHKSIKPGVSGLDLEKIAQDYIDKYNLKGAFKGYYGFPANICFSVNECVVHGIPSDYKLKEGDLVKIDAGITYKSMISDAAFSKIVGGNEYNQLGAELVKATKKALDEGIKTLKVGGNFYNLGKTIFNVMKKNGFSVIKNLTGHGVGVKVHEGPYIYNYPNKELKDTIIKNGMSFAIEPITAVESTSWIEKEPGGWDLLCEKGDLGAQWEYTLIVMNNKIEIVAGLTEDNYLN